MGAELEMPNLQNCTLIHASSRAEIEAKIDTLLATTERFKDVPLILSADGQSRRYGYSGVTIREWHHAGNVRFDAAIEVLNG